MTLNNSKCSSILKRALIVPFFIILGITLGCEPASIKENNQAEQINLELINNETVKLNGKTVSASEFGAAFSNLSIDPKQVLIYLKIHKNTPMGLVTDVEEVLREHGTLRINYSIVQLSRS